MKKWEIKGKLRKKKNTVITEELVTLLLKNRGITTKRERDVFLAPSLSDVTTTNVGIDTNEVTKTLKRVEKAINNNEQIVVFGDYDVDGITSSAILWETLYKLGAKCTPYIPGRIEEGYGLSTRGIMNMKTQIPDVSLIITVDNGIVAHQAVSFANEQGIDVVITDHHTTAETLPSAYSIVHTTLLCGAGVAYVLSKEILKHYNKKEETKMEEDDTHLELAALGTIADLVPLVGPNRTLVSFGLQKLRQTKRVGLLALYKTAKLNKQTIGTYEVGFLIAPRLNASGRLASAMDSLRLICTRDKNRAEELALLLETTNRQRQIILKDTAEHALETLQSENATTKHILIIAHETYQEGIIGLVAGKIVEAFYRPAIVIAKGEKMSKASARSINGFNIIEFLRLNMKFFVNVGGHPMAAGFTIATENIVPLQNELELLAQTTLTEASFVRSLTIDCELELSDIDQKMYMQIQQLAPFGMGNQDPTFVARKVVVKNIRILGDEKKHVKLTLKRNDKETIDAIGFNLARYATSLKNGDAIDLAYTIDENTWNGNTTLQLKMKDIVQLTD